MGDVGDAERIDDLDHLPALAYHDVSFTQFANDLYGTVTLLWHAGLLLGSV